MQPTTTPDKAGERSGDWPIFVYATFPTIEAAEQAGGVLLDQRLAACINILPGMISLYAWQGRRQRDNEAVMIIKTRHALADAAIASVKAQHPYDVPAMVILDTAGGYPPFLQWIMDETRSA